MSVCIVRCERCWDDPAATRSPVLLRIDDTEEGVCFTTRYGVSVPFQAVGAIECPQCGSTRESTASVLISRSRSVPPCPTGAVTVLI